MMSKKTDLQKKMLDLINVITSMFANLEVKLASTEKRRHIL